MKNDYARMLEELAQEFPALEEEAQSLQDGLAEFADDDDAEEEDFAEDEFAEDDFSEDDEELDFPPKKKKKPKFSDEDEDEDDIPLF